MKRLRRRPLKGEAVGGPICGATVVHHNPWYEYETQQGVVHVYRYLPLDKDCNYRPIWLYQGTK